MNPNNFKKIINIETLWIFFTIFLVSSFYWWGRISIGNFKVPIVSFLIPVIVYIWILSLSSSDTSIKNIYLIKTFIFPLFIMIWGMGLSLIGSENYLNTCLAIGEMILYVVLYFLIIKTINTASGLYRIISTLIFCVAFFAVDGLYKFFITETIWRIGAGNVLTPTNMGAFMFQSVILLLLSKIVFDKGLSLYGKFAFTAILAIILAAFIFTYSRGAWITTLIGVFILIRFRKILILPAILIPIILIPFLPEAISNRIISIFDYDRTSTVYLYRDVKINNTTSLRLGNWKNTLSDINEKPLLGQGLGFYHGDDKGEYAPHNTYLRIWAEAGIIAIFGFFLFLYNLISIFEKVIPLVDGKWKWIIIGNYSIVVTHMFYMILGDWAYQMYYWVFSGIASASVNLFASTCTKTNSISENSQM